MSSAPTRPDAILHARDIEFTYPASSPAARPFSLSVSDLEVRAGEVLALCGSSGSGKSTLLAILAGLLRPRSGVVTLSTAQGPVELYGCSDADWRRHRRHFGYVHQDPRESLNDRRIVADIVADPLEIHGLPEGDVSLCGGNRIAWFSRRAVRRSRREAAISLLQRVGITESQAERTPEALSGGQRQRVAIARALVVNPLMVFLDEPTSALDLSVQATIVELLHRLRDQDPRMAYLLVTHDLALARQLADRFAILEAGRLVESGDVRQLPDHPGVQRDR
jgi:peptide/nickel transport system ATP-binding protein/oligopeptide transport system ATP-binding protein